MSALPVPIVPLARRERNVPSRSRGRANSVSVPSRSTKPCKARVNGRRAGEFHKEYGLRAGHGRHTLAGGAAVWAAAFALHWTSQNTSQQPDDRHVSQLDAHDRLAHGSATGKNASVAVRCLPPKEHTNNCGNLMDSPTVSRLKIPVLWGMICYSCAGVSTAPLGCPPFQL